MDKQDSGNATLAQYIRRRRKQLGLSQSDLQVRGGPSAATVRLIEAGVSPQLQRGTKRGIEAALDWPEGAIDMLLGDNPAKLSPQAWMRAVKTLLEAPEGTPGENAEPGDQDDGVVLSLPPGSLDGLSAADREEVLAIGKAAMLARAREIKRGQEQS